MLNIDVGNVKPHSDLYNKNSRNLVGLQEETSIERTDCDEPNSRNSGRGILLSISGLRYVKHRLDEHQNLRNFLPVMFGGGIDTKNLFFFKSNCSVDCMSFYNLTFYKIDCLRTHNSENLSLKLSFKRNTESNLALKNVWRVF